MNSNKYPNVELVAISKMLLDGKERGHDHLIAHCARVSNPENQHNQDTAPRLLRYLAKHQHWSPFEMCHMVLGITTTRDIARQILRHRSFSFQEFSQRYAKAAGEAVIREARLQDQKNRQSSLETDDPELTRWWAQQQEKHSEEAHHIYDTALQLGIAKEVARSVLPEGNTQSVLYMAGTIRSWIHYIQLRTHEGTQKEHREIALQCKGVLLEQLPNLEEIFND